MALAVALSTAACSMIEAGTRPAVSNGRVYVYEDGATPRNHGEWTNHMPGPVNVTDVAMISLNMVDRERPWAGEESVRIEVTFHPPNWCGLAVVTEPDAWGVVPVPTALDLTGAKRLVFHARGKHGGEVIEVKLATTGNQRYGDSARRPVETDSTRIRLGTEWSRFEIPLDGVDLRRVINVFAFYVDKAHNPADSMIFYFDEIYFEMDAAA